MLQESVGKWSAAVQLQTTVTCGTTVLSRAGSVALQGDRVQGDIAQDMWCRVMWCRVMWFRVM